VVKSKLLALIVIFSASLSFAQPSTEDKTKARTLAESGLAHFNKSEYELACKDLFASYGLDPAPATAALASQAQANLDRSHPSKALAWLRSWVIVAGKEPIDPKGWQAVQRAHDAVIGAAISTETDAAAAQTTAQELLSKNKDLQDEVQRLQAENVKLKHAIIRFESALPPGDRADLKHEIE
jgi:hypothetical protein